MRRLALTPLYRIAAWAWWLLLAAIIMVSQAHDEFVRWRGKHVRWQDRDLINRGALLREEKADGE